MHFAALATPFQRLAQTSGRAAGVQVHQRPHDRRRPVAAPHRPGFGGVCPLRMAGRVQGDGGRGDGHRRAPAAAGRSTCRSRA